MSQVVLDKIVKSYGDVDVVHGIDLTVTSKEFVVLVGPSGCGKSTTLRMIAGLEEISGGNMSIGDRVVNDIAPKDRDVAMVFQNYALYPHLNVSENIAFGLRIRKVDKDEITKSVTEVAEILGLTDYLDRKPADLSGGQRFSSLMNHYPIWTRSSEHRCVLKSNDCINDWVSPAST